jgi:hypothetical protein
LSTEKIAALAPIPSVSVAKAVSAKAGCRRHDRQT